MSLRLTRPPLLPPPPQVGGEVLAVHPDYVLAALSEAELNEYLSKRQQREAHTYRYYHDAMTNTQPFVRVKNEPPYSEADEKAVYLNPQARAQYDPVKRTWRFKEGTASKASRKSTPQERAMALALQEALVQSASTPQRQSDGSASSAPAGSSTPSR